MSGEEAWEQPTAGRRWWVMVAALGLAAGVGVWAGGAHGDRAPPALDVSEVGEPLPPPSPNPAPTEAPGGVGRWQQVAHAPIVRRTGHSAVWTGDEVIVWGGVRTDPRPHVEEARFLADGAAYATRRDTWRRLPAAPLAGRYGHHAVWTGREMLVWGGSAGGPGAAYDPRTNRWRTLPAADELPAPPGDATIVEAGRRLVLWDGAGGTVLRAGARTWEPLSPPPLEPREGAAVVWAADRLFVWGGAAAPRHYADGAVLHLPPYGHGSRVSVGR